MTSPPLQNFIDQWHRIFSETNPALILPLIRDDIEFYSPAVYAPKHGKQQVFDTLNLVFDVFENYRVTDTWVKENDVLFEFEANVGKYTLQGIDRFHLDDEGKVVQMKVWIRPLTGLRELARIVARRELENHLATKSGGYKTAVRARIRAGSLFKAIKDGFK